MKTEQSKQISFKGQSLYIGIDVHLKSWSATVLSDAAVVKKISRMNPSPEELVAILHREFPGADYYSVYEAGFCGFWIHERLTALGVNNIVVNPADVPTTEGERMRKTDAIDSRKLAMGLRAKQLKGIYTPSGTALELRSLTRLKNSITKDTTRQKNRIKSHLMYMGIEIPEEYHNPNHKWTKGFVEWLKGIEMKTSSGKETLNFQIAQLENLDNQKKEVVKAIRELAKTEQFAKPLELVMSVPGIGETIGMLILSEICDFDRFTSAEKFAAFVGMIPMCHSSGERDGTGDITMRHHASIRSNLIEAAWVSIRKDPAMSLVYTENCKRMIPSKAIVKVARKLCNRIFFVLKHKKKYVSGVVQ